MSFIYLTNSDKRAIVDGMDWVWASKLKWFLHHGYAARSEASPRRTVYLHREILKNPPRMHSDHINGNRLDNRRENLRVCTQGENNRNKAKYRNKSSQYKGVSWDSTNKSWYAQIIINKKHYSLGHYRNELEAAKAYDEGAKKHHGEFARINFK